MPTGRLEAFSDAVIAIVMTVMVLELRPPDEPSWTALTTLAPNFLVYLLSFVYLGIYWNNHHHMLHTCHRVTGGIMWANLHLLFWLSLFPFATGWIGRNHNDAMPTALYGAVCLMSAIAYYILQSTIIRSQGNDSILARAIGRDIKGKISPILYAVAIGLAFVEQWASDGVYVLVALIWLIPDRRVERVLERGGIDRAR